MQKGKHSVIDIDTSEPSDIQSVQTDTSSEEGFLTFGGIQKNDEENDIEITERKVALNDPSVEAENFKPQPTKEDTYDPSTEWNMDNPTDVIKVKTKK